MKELIEIQAELKSPKNQRNNFGNYNYRSCEDILEAVKPLLEAKGCVLTLSDEVVNVGDKNYVKATAIFYYTDGNIQTTALAREAVTQKKVSDPQITGSASSYARKYALNGLFAIDDTKDDDATNQHNKPQAIKHTVDEVKSLAKLKNVDEAKICEAYKVLTIDQMDQATLNKVFNQLKAK